MAISSRVLGLLSAGLLAVAGASSLVYHASPARADDPGRSTVGGNGPMKDELNEQTRTAVKKGLAWLAKNVGSEGTVNAEGGESIAVMSLAGIAFLADGNMPNDGQYGKETARVLEYVVKNCQETGLIAGPRDGEPMYGHGFATLFLAESYGMSQDPQVGEKLRMAIRLIVRTQNDAGGWRYQPVKSDADISVTICQIMALRAARNDGIAVPNETIDKAIKYVKNSQEADGGFRYVINQPGSAYPRSAAGVACLYYMRSGNDFAEEIKRGIQYLKVHMPTSTNGRDSMDVGNFFYGNYYATQAMFMYGGDAWEAYWPAIRKILLARQDAAGSWSGETGPVYATSMALIMLQVPNRLLPILQK